MTSAGDPPGLRRVLVVEDDADLREGLAYNLRSQGYEVVALASAAQVDPVLASEPVDLLILDVMLPGEDGYALCRRLRNAGFVGMVLMLTARSLEEDVVRGFEAGAQDYVVKPFRRLELVARVAALLRRPGVPRERTTFGTLTVDEERRVVTRQGGSTIELTRTEFDLLAFLVRNRNRAVTRAQILDAVWGEEVVVAPRTVDNFISSLKKKLGWSPSAGFAFRTLRGSGTGSSSSMTEP